MFKEKGYSIVAVVSTAEQAIQISQSTPCDVVIMDINLKGEMTGIEAASAIFSLNNKTEIVFVSAADRLKIDFTTVSGPYEFISKPFTNDQIIDAVNRCLERKKGNK